MREKLLEQQRTEIDQLQQTLTAEQEEFKQRTAKEQEKELQTLKDTLSVERDKVNYCKATALRINLLCFLKCIFLHRQGENWIVSKQNHFIPPSRQRKTK